MTAPLVQAPQPQSSVGNLLPLIMHISEARQHLAMERERLDLDKQRTQAELLRGETLDAEAKARLKQAQLKLDTQIQENAANTAAAEHLHVLALAPGAFSQDGTFDPTVVAKTRAGMLKSVDPKLAADALKKFDETVGGLDQQLGQHAQAQRFASEARVALQTEQARIDAEKLKPKVEQAAIAREKAYEEAERARRKTEMLSFWKSSGQPFSVARSLYGEPAGGMPDNAVAGAAGANAQMRTRAQAASVLLGRGNLVLNAEKNRALDPIAATMLFGSHDIAEVMASGGGSVKAPLAWFAGDRQLAAVMLSEKVGSYEIDQRTRRVMLADRDIAVGAIQLTSGARGTTELRRDIMRIFTILRGDDQQTSDTKDFMRLSFEREAKALSEGKRRPVESVDRLLMDARGRLPASAIAALTELRAGAVRYEASGGPDDPNAGDAGQDPSLKRAQNFLGAALQGLVVQPGPPR